MAKNLQKLCQNFLIKIMAKSGKKWQKMAKNGKKWQKMAKCQSAKKEKNRKNCNQPQKLLF
jgi:hypothetical protein